MYIEKVQATIAELPTLQGVTFRPCSQEEVQALEQFIGRPLPLAYREFLLLMGKGMDEFLRGSEIFYPTMYELQQDAVELLKEDDFPEQLPRDAFVFFMHEGYQFNFFHTSEGDDPPVYRFYEGKDPNSFRLIYPHFTSFLVRELQNEAWYRQLIERGKQRSEGHNTSSN
jgi:hypothetical protein